MPSVMSNIEYAELANFRAASESAKYQVPTQTPVKIMEWEDGEFVIINLEIGGLLYSNENFVGRKRWGGSGDLFNDGDLVWFPSRIDAEDYLSSRPQMQLIPQGELA